MRRESFSPSPMTWLAFSRVGTSSPRSRLASWMHSAMVPAESISVPSQSKTMRAYFRGVSA